MQRLLVISAIIIFAFNNLNAFADEPSPEPSRQERGDSEHRGERYRANTDNPPSQRHNPHFRGREIVVDISARIVERDQQITSLESHRATTFPGQPVGIKLVGSNVVVSAQFTPYIRRGAQKFLVAQGQVWIDIPEQGIKYQNSMQTIPLEFGEEIYFFPLGSSRGDNTEYIEIMLILYPYEEEN